MIYHFDNAIPERLKGDVERFQQIMINLIRNALKFTNNGVIKVKLFFEK